MSGAIDFDGLGHAYASDRWIFRNYRGSAAGGSIFAILGPNGRGKTTLLKILLGVLNPSEGSISRLGRIAFVPQLFQVSFDYTALDIVLMGRAASIGLFSQPSARDESLALTTLGRLGMAEWAHQPFHRLSGGGRQLVILARALVAGATILILDEPASALDLKNQGLVLEWIERLAHRDGLTVVFTTHHPQHAQAVADQVLLMFGGSDYACGPAADVLTESNLQRLYGIEMRRVALEISGQSISTFVPVYPSVHRERR